MPKKKEKKRGRPKSDYPDLDEYQKFYYPSIWKKDIEEMKKQLATTSKSEVFRQAFIYFRDNYKQKSKDKQKLKISIDDLEILREAMYHCEVSRIIKHHISQDISACIQAYKDTALLSMKTAILVQIYELIEGHPDFKKLLNINDIEKIIEKILDEIEGFV